MGNVRLREGERKWVGGKRESGREIKVEKSRDDSQHSSGLGFLDSFFFLSLVLPEWAKSPSWEWLRIWEGTGMGLGVGIGCKVRVKRGLWFRAAGLGRSWN